jgi:Flp pilus assembly protein TadD
MYRSLIALALTGAWLLPARAADIEQADLPTRHRALQKHYKTLERNDKILQKEVDDLNDKAQRLENEADALRDELKEAAKQIVALEDAGEAYRKALSKAESERDRALEEGAAQVAEIEALEETVKAQAVLVDEHSRDLRALRKKLAGEGTSQDRAVAEAALARANAWMDEGRTAEAAEAYREAQASWPGIPGARTGLATYHYLLGNNEVAATLVDEVLDEDSKNAEALRLAGLIAWHENDLRKASKYLGRALKERPDDDGLHVYQGMVYYGMEKYDQAIEELTSALMLNRDNAEARFNLAVVMASRDEPDLEGARLHYQAALQLGIDPDPDLENVLFQE